MAKIHSSRVRCGEPDTPIWSLQGAMKMIARAAMISPANIA